MPTAARSFRAGGPVDEPAEQLTTTQRGYGWDWQQISKLKRRQQPVCEVCRDALAEDVDHIRPFKGVDDPLRTAWDNLRSICRPCHLNKNR